jgi:hypothetical protein
VHRKRDVHSSLVRVPRGDTDLQRQGVSWPAAAGDALRHRIHRAVDNCQPALGNNRYHCDFHNVYHHNPHNVYHHNPHNVYHHNPYHDNYQYDDHSNDQPVPHSDYY